MTLSRNPLVSILIPAYNSAKWIAATIESALSQTWQRKEIIVVDDGSRDGTPEIARRFEARDVRVVVQTNQGAAAARNKAFSICQGDYIQWLDADDLLDPEKISLQLQAVERGAGSRTLLSCGWAYFFHRPRNARFSPTALWCDLPSAEWMMRKMEQNLHMQTATWLVSRELTESAGPWDTRMYVDDDGEYFCRVMLQSDGIRFSPGAKVFYRRSGSNGLSYIGRSDTKKDAQFLSMRLHIQYLLSVANYERSRAACCRYLQNGLVHFYPERPDIVEQAQQLAAGLGHTLEMPKLSWKYGWIQKAFGWESARRVQILLPQFKHDLIRSCDKALSYFQ